MAFAVSAPAAGFSLRETLLFSIVVFAGSAQMATVGLAASGAGPGAIVLTALGLNLRHGWLHQKCSRPGAIGVRKQCLWQ